MFLSNQIAGFFDHQYLWKESINILEFLHEGSQQGKISSETFSIYYFWFDEARRARLRPNFPRLAHAGFG